MLNMKHHTAYWKRNRIGQIWHITRMFLATALIITVILFWCFLHESRSDYIATPYVMPWFPAVFSPVSVRAPTDPEINPYLCEFSNPCFLARHANFVFGPTLAASEADRKSNSPVTVSVLEQDGTCSTDTLRCVPYFYLLGWPKCGTTDMHAKLTAHPYIIRSPTKEPAWFSNYRGFYNLHFSDALNELFTQISVPREYFPSWETIYKKFIASSLFSSLNAYIDYYNDLVTAKLGKYMGRYGGPVPLKFADLSTHTIDMNRIAERGFKYNNRTAPGYDPTTVPKSAFSMQYTTPLLIRQISPEARFIVMIRDPIERLYSLYRMHDANSREDFHKGCMIGIQMWNKCIHKNYMGASNCIYSFESQVENETNIISKWTARAIFSIPRSLYVFYLNEWFSIFPRDKFLFINFDDWAKNNSDIVNHEVFPFLDLPKLSGYNSQRLYSREHQTVVRKRPKPDGTFVEPWTQGDMLPQTRRMLQDFYRPYNAMLAKLLQNPKYNWQYNNS